uniref:Uncharacterized protein n=1 Tax=Lotharella oceanica TaxID=641309 RepID=A0A7S2U6E3_9EUKA|mmetsp:Transcript_9849/g.18922  ORF Transcript_9849/g.18922 Transcript_9849/m.18922 type:complete len:128 (+) Transcript_9849:867-1250(+)|eukprot:CAMPEP_0170194320 /NCGR_PEP_ID=MMETSP0040_2-20121228/58944_1 /TAXON_ID=641309 /ORGANISM="Lotharella oceanica, Strain CCMP622" /LENGTH=127 /DNA_ID=CAMNT_0010443211 /DNA_START=853 /DNA_END=1236 /DNA_ORIENTATION=-
MSGWDGSSELYVKVIERYTKKVLGERVISGSAGPLVPTQSPTTVGQAASNIITGFEVNGKSIRMLIKTVSSTTGYYYTVFDLKSGGFKKIAGKSHFWAYSHRSYKDLYLSHWDGSSPLMFRLQASIF